VRKDWSQSSLYLNLNHLHNWGIGFNYYYEYAYMPFEVVAKVCQLDLVFFNITFTRWSRGTVFPGI